MVDIDHNFIHDIRYIVFDRTHRAVGNHQRTWFNSARPKQRLGLRQARSLDQNLVVGQPQSGHIMPTQVAKRNRFHYFIACRY